MPCYTPNCEHRDERRSHLENRYSKIRTLGKESSECLTSVAPTESADVVALKPIITMREQRPPIVLGDKVWCPRCGEYVKVVRVTSAAKIVDVDRRTVYNYVKKNKVFAVKVAGSTLRVCTHCLLRENDEQPSAANEYSFPAKRAAST
jgi:hypothetical protein